jgi:hypothetical protein
VSGLRVNDDGSCIVGRCEQPGTIRMRLISFGEESEADFCEGCAPHYRPCWKPVEPTGQLTLDAA